MFTHTGPSFERHDSTTLRALDIRDALCLEVVGDLARDAVHDVISAFVSSFLNVAAATHAAEDPLGDTAGGLLDEVVGVLVAEAVQETVVDMAQEAVLVRRSTGACVGCGNSGDFSRSACTEGARK